MLQLIVTGGYSSGQRHHLTHDLKYSVDAPTVVSVEAEGLIAPMLDGKATITARVATGQTATLALTTSQCAEELPVNFEKEIVPIFTKLGCNAGGCHAEAHVQNGFKLSLPGFYPKEDYEYLVYEDCGRRVFPADPDFSLLLQKPGNILPHGGGQRMSPGSYEWELVERWIRQGMPYGAETDPTLVRIESVPTVRENVFQIEATTVCHRALS